MPMQSLSKKQLENIFQPTPSCRNKYVLGGMHLTNPAFLPWAILKEISGTENGQTLKNIHMHDITLEEMNRQQVNSTKQNERRHLCFFLQSLLYLLAGRPKWRGKTDPIDEVNDVSKQLPWFLECNPSRYFGVILMFPSFPLL